MLPLHRHCVGLVAVALLYCGLPARAAEPAKYLLDDTSAVVRIDVRQLVGSGVYRKELDKFVQPLLKNESLLKALKSAGIDPLQDVESMLIATGLTCHRTEVKGKTTALRSGALCIVQGRFDRAKLQGVLNQLAKDQPKDVKIEKAANGTIYDVSEFLGGSMFLVVADSNTVVAAMFKDQAEDVLAKAAGQKKTQLKYKAVQALVDSMDPKQATAWAASGEMVAGSSTQLASVNGKTVVKVDHEFLKDSGIESISGGVALADDVRGRMTLVAKDAATADKLRASIGAGLEDAKKGIAQAAGVNKDLAPLLDALKSVQVRGKDATIVGEGQASGPAFVAAVAQMLQFMEPKPGPNGVFVPAGKLRE